MAEVPSEQDVRAQVREWLEVHWNPELPLLEWRSTLADSGWACPVWPSEWFGKGLPSGLAAAADDERDRFGAVGPAGGSGMTLAAPTILEHGSADLKSRLLRPIVTGEHRWCQLFSEPGSGSDLAGLTTRAELDGDEWVVSGQKVWTTGARSAMYGMLLARTDWDVPKHRGITYFALPIQQVGVEVRPLRQMNGYASFNEVFLTEARIPAGNVVGQPGEGWRAAVATLAFERLLPALRMAAKPPSGAGRTHREAAAESADYLSSYVWYPQRAGRVDLIAPQIADHGRSEDAVVRDHAAGVLSLDRTARWSASRARAARAAGKTPGPEGSIAKLIGSEISRRAARVHAEIAGAEALLTGPDAPAAGIVAEILLSTPGQSIAGGTDEIQKNIIGERALGLPKEPSLDAEQPFRTVRTNPSHR